MTIHQIKWPCKDWKQHKYQLADAERRLAKRLKSWQRKVKER